MHNTNNKNRREALDQVCLYLENLIYFSKNIELWANIESHGLLPKYDKYSAMSEPSKASLIAAVPLPCIAVTIFAVMSNGLGGLLAGIPLGLLASFLTFGLMNLFYLLYVDFQIAHITGKCAHTERGNFPVTESVFNPEMIDEQILKAAFVHHEMYTRVHQILQSLSGLEYTPALETILRSLKAHSPSMSEYALLDHTEKQELDQMLTDIEKSLGISYKIMQSV